MSVIVLNVITLNTIMLNVIMLNAIILNAIKSIVMAPLPTNFPNPKFELKFFLPCHSCKELELSFILKNDFQFAKSLQVSPVEREIETTTKLKGILKRLSCN
jgi:hypothetical protein